jgi:hypothetical protein
MLDIAFLARPDSAVFALIADSAIMFLVSAPAKAPLGSRRFNFNQPTALEAVESFEDRSGDYAQS